MYESVCVAPLFVEESAKLTKTGVTDLVYSLLSNVKQPLLLLQSVDKLIFKWDTAWFKLDKAQEVAARTGKRPQMNSTCCHGPKVGYCGMNPYLSPTPTP